MVVCQHYGLQKKLLCVLEIVFLGTFDKIATVHDTSCHNPTLTWLLQYLQYVIYFCIAENIFIWSVYWFIWTEHLQNVGLKQTKKSLRDLLNYCMSIVVIYPFQSHTMDYRILPHYYCGKIKYQWPHFYISCLFHSVNQKLLLKF